METLSTEGQTSRHTGARKQPEHAARLHAAAPKQMLPVDAEPHVCVGTRSGGNELVLGGGDVGLTHLLDRVLGL